MNITAGGVLAVAAAVVVGYVGFKAYKAKAAIGEAIDNVGAKIGAAVDSAVETAREVGETVAAPAVASYDLGKAALGVATSTGGAIRDALKGQSRPGTYDSFIDWQSASGAAMGN